MNYRIVFLFLLSASIAQSSVVRQIICEKELANGLRHRVVLEADHHTFKGLVANDEEQVTDLSNAFHKALENSPDAKLYLEMVNKKYFDISKKIWQITEKGGTFKLPDIKKVTAKRKKVNKKLIEDILENFKDAQPFANRDQQFLYKLACNLYNDKQVKFADTRTYFRTLVNGLDRSMFGAVLKDFDCGNYLINQLRTIPVTGPEFFNVVDELHVDTQNQINNLLAVTTDDQTNKDLQEYSKQLKHLVHYVNTGKHLFSSSDWYFLQEIIDSSIQLISSSNYISDMTQYQMDLYVSNIFALDYFIHKSATILNLDIFDIELLASIFQNSPNVCVVVAGEKHIQNILPILQREKYEIIYDSYLTFQGHRFDNTDAFAYLTFSHPDAWSIATIAMNQMREYKTVIFDPIKKDVFNLMLLNTADIKEAWEKNISSKSGLDFLLFGSQDTNHKVSEDIDDRDEL